MSVTPRNAPLLQATQQEIRWLQLVCEHAKTGSSESRRSLIELFDAKPITQNIYLENVFSVYVECKLNDLTRIQSAARLALSACRIFSPKHERRPMTPDFLKG